MLGHHTFLITVLGEAQLFLHQTLGGYKDGYVKELGLHHQRDSFDVGGQIFRRLTPLGHYAYIVR